MKIKGKSVRSITKIIAAAKNSNRIQLAYRIDPSNTDKIRDVGFDENPSIGDYLIPAPLGKATQANSLGRQVVRKDLPKEPEPVSFHTSWTDWHGYQHSGIQTRYIDKYPREYIPADEEELTVCKINGGDAMYIVTDMIDLQKTDEKRIIHLSNIMLECFGEFEILDIDSGKIAGTKLKQLHWEILPKGSYPWSKTKGLVGEVTGKLKDSERLVVESRMEHISKFNPDFLATGRAGFSGYFVYGFSAKKIYLLESIHLDNATYVFGDNWEALSTLTKNEIINGDVGHTRIIHDKKWKRSIRELLS
ncbi:hypothetical protein [Neptuniibacter sp. CAU 1671]|uniref:hypothetical protein n=1 Tax=Neptuniibacter sp. CAU 1671 TaxID=3032593 RepID=UPI0023DCA305|nr:hypothetical protein [Neptuniibacter sp. CAU 1671]MDF2180526.1 hypothetical protein [Neptuniibacter sp. CAU 1671]